MGNLLSLKKGPRRYQVENELLKFLAIINWVCDVECLAEVFVEDAELAVRESELIRFSLDVAGPFELQDVLVAGQHGLDVGFVLAALHSQPIVLFRKEDYF